MVRHATRKYLSIAAAALIAAVSVSNAAPRNDDQVQAFPGDTMSTVELVAARKQDVSNIESFDEAINGIDPIVTGPISAKFQQQRVAAGCDQAVWPNVPKACYPN